MIKTPNSSFKSYIWEDKTNRLILTAAALLMLVQFSSFKYFYPHVGFIDGDSYVYLETAQLNYGINFYMIGYSMFLRLFSIFSTSDLLLVAFQYLFIEFCALLMLFTIFYFFNTFRLVKYILLTFIVINPLFLYMANYVSSDAFFLALSLLWFASLLWVIHRPSTKNIIYNSIILVICFTVRYNALIYPFIFLIALILTRASIRIKLPGLLLALILIGSFVIYNGNKYKELTGTWQYTPFSGWQLANNAMYAFRYVDSANRKPAPAKLKDLDYMVRTYFDSSRNPFKNPWELEKASTAYMWSPKFTLQKYKNLRFAHDSTASNFKKWASMGPIYSQYGFYLIKQYPMYFLEYFVCPNACKYYAPPVEFLSQYNSGEDTVKDIAVQWFGYKSPKVGSKLSNSKIKALNYYPILTGIVNVVYFLSLLCLLNLRYFRKNTPSRNSIVLVTFFWLGNAFFTILSSAAALRFQAFPIILVTIYSLILIEFMYKLSLEQDQARRETTVENELHLSITSTK